MRPSTALLAALAAAALLSAPACAPAQPSRPATEPATGDTAGLSSLSPEELFLRASSSALQFEHMREPSRRILVRDHERTVPYLLTRLDTDDARERHALEDVLVRIGEPVVAPLTDALTEELTKEDTSRGARLAALALGRLKSDHAVPALEAGADHGDWKVRSSVASALGRIGDMAAEDTLLALLGDDNEVVRKSAAVALARIAEDEQTRLDADALSALAGALRDQHYSVRFSAARALGSSGEDAVEVLEPLAYRGDGPARILAVRALGRIGSPDARSLLRRLTRSDDPIVRAHAAYGLGETDPQRRDRDRLKDLLQDPHPLVVFVAREALQTP